MNEASIKSILIDTELHRRIKLAAYTSGVTIRDFTEAALRHALDGNGKRLVDTPEPYRVKEATECSNS